jgi:hypothetical protein
MKIRMPKLENVYELKKILEESEEVELRFVKKNNESRYMRCTRNKERMANTQPIAEREDQKISDQLDILKQVRVFDLDKQEWRTVNYETVVWLIFKDKDGDYNSFQVIPERESVAKEGYSL